MSLERLDNQGPYSPENCVWANAKSQANNRTSNLLVSIQGEVMTATQASESVGLAPGTVYARKRKGWPEADWFKPVGYKRNKPKKVTI
jgi:hypothetical protein